MYIITNLRTNKQTAAQDEQRAIDSVERWHRESGDHYIIEEIRRVYQTDRPKLRGDTGGEW